MCGGQTSTIGHDCRLGNRQLPRDADAPLRVTESVGALAEPQQGNGDAPNVGGQFASRCEIVWTAGQQTFVEP
jgi:hypothetical protein